MHYPVILKFDTLVQYGSSEAAELLRCISSQI